MAVRDAAGLPRSMALSGDLQREADAMAWYVDRNDYPRTVSSGVQSVTVERADVYIYDRQSSYNGRPHNHYHETRIVRQSTIGTR
jgi:hypothetical protein